MKKTLLIATACLMLLTACNQKSQTQSNNCDNIYQFSVVDGNHDTVSLANYSGKVLLVVNTATQCGFTPQYEELERLYNKYRSQGFEILDFPCNQFGGQAPGSYDDIHSFCTLNYNISFPQMDKIEVNGNGPDVSPLYTWLKSKAPFGGFDLNDPIGAYLDQMFRSQDSLYDQNPDIKWNFTKFLIDRDGNVKARFEPTAKADEIDAAIAALL